MYLTSLCYKYAVKKDEDTLDRIWYTFGAIERHYKVTPDENYGLMARSVLFTN